MGDEIPKANAVAWPEREGLWWVVRYQSRPGEMTLTVDARFLLRRTAANVAFAVFGAHCDGSSAAERHWEERCEALAQEKIADGKMYRDIIAGLKARPSASVVEG